MTMTDDSLVIDVRPWSRRTKLVVYGIVPVATSLALIAAYFSGIPLLQQIVSPRISWLHPDSGREFGLLENLQNVCLIAMICVFFRGFRNKRIPLERAAFAFLTLLAVVVLLEEIDYGAHYYDAVFHRSGEALVERAPRNLHNRGEANKAIKNLVDLGMALLFFVLPLWRPKRSSPLLRYLTPDPHTILTLAAMLALKWLAHGLQDAGFGGTGSIGKNISEFRELNTYYLFLVYSFDIVLHRNYGRLPTPAPAVAATERG
jgi:hypothetical protein